MKTQTNLANRSGSTRCLRSELPRLNGSHEGAPRRESGTTGSPVQFTRTVLLTSGCSKRTLPRLVCVVFSVTTACSVSVAVYVGALDSTKADEVCLPKATTVRGLARNETRSQTWDPIQYISINMFVVARRYEPTLAGGQRTQAHL